jgi:hypothetical chaperone protein
MSTSRWARRSALPPGYQNRPRSWSPTSAAGRATSRWCRSLHPGLRSDACRWAMPELGSPATRSISESSTISDFSDWSRLAFMRNRKTLSALEKLRRVATDPVPIERMIAVVDQELGYRLYEAVGQVKRDLSSTEAAQLRFNGAGLSIEAEVIRAAFEGWISPDLERIGQTLDRAMSSASVGPENIDRVFLTGGSSLIPRIRQLFAERFGAERIATGGELTSIAHGLALIGAEDNPAAWAA